ncbi:MAG: hypothetical protein EA400_01905 [Chromatiaceae bacterium]|nr:MAG: hypothetical protein EA400_01905 [Chromatiaceae bacterium]
MLQMRREQMDAFGAAARRGFEQQMLVHLAEFSPPLFRAVGPEPLRLAIRLGMERAAGYGFTTRGPVRLWLESALLFGSFFDTDPQYPQIGALLADADQAPEMARAERLYAWIKDYRARVAGPDDAYTLRALGNLAALARQPLDWPPEHVVPALLAEITTAYPEKADFVGQEALTALIRKAMAGARAQHFTNSRGMALVLVLMLAFGHGCGADPLYPWIARTLRDPVITDPAARAQRLEKKALTWLRHVLTHFDVALPA